MEKVNTPGKLKDRMPECFFRLTPACKKRQLRKLINHFCYLKDKKSLFKIENHGKIK